MGAKRIIMLLFKLLLFAVITHTNYDFIMLAKGMVIIYEVLGINVIEFRKYK